MKKFFGLLFVLVVSVLTARTQDTTTCESHTDGDTSVTVCTSDEYKSVTSCDHDGSSSSCTSTTRRLKDEEDSDENLRELCTSGMNVDCEKLVSRVETHKKVGSICDEDYVRAHQPEKCKKEADDLKLNEQVVSKYLEREEAKRTAKTLELCEKRVFDKDYCETFKKKLQAKAQDHPATEAH